MQRKGNLTTLSDGGSLILHDNLRWLLSSGIMIKEGEDKGGIYGWKNPEPPLYPFIYSEITGYAITCFSWIYDEFRSSHALQAAVECSKWIMKNMTSSCLIAAGKIKTEGFSQKGQLSNLFYAFDNGMIMIGLLNLYKITKTSNLLSVAECIAQSIISRFFDGSKLTALLNSEFRPLSSISGNVKWSTLSGAYHCKLSMALLELSRLTGNQYYSQISNSICRYALELQKSNGRFITNPQHEETYLHPHLYACEGLIYAGISQSSPSFYRAGINGIKWAIKLLDSASGKLPRSTLESTEQSDCIAQLLRLVILSRSALTKFLNSSLVDTAIDRLYSRLLDFYIAVGEDHGGMRYNPTSPSACSWCTMFTMQALRLWNKRKEKNVHAEWIDYFI